ncbi:hypothetical protein D3M95_00870 [Corynebacterium falsenii]|uniref:Uncharacterized protein n=1 Tax=Corynebacterium falsenii TaxID=108486 RepID=A0A418QA59_9CORY|nr:beta-class phenol-soluble modulin [Corynebacterium falsenii]RIX36793.1 hypothetical protein D3M95_00870 [Corynebacterium falsenii]
MIDQIVDLGGNIIDIVFSAISGNWSKLAQAILNTVGGVVDLGSSAIDSSSEAGDAAAGATDAANAGAEATDAAAATQE